MSVDVVQQGQALCQALLLGGVMGIWLATPVAELLGTVMAVALLLKYRQRYGY